MSETDFSGLRVLTMILFISLFVSSDCERSFSLMNKLKRAEKPDKNLERIDVTIRHNSCGKNYSQKIADSWEYEKKDDLSPELRRNIAENNSTMFV